MVTDEQLLAAVSRGDQTAFEAFIHRWHGPLLGYLERMLQDSGRAEDLVQETFIRLIHQLKQKRTPGNARAWLYKVASNLCRDYWRSASYRSEKNILADVPEKADTKTSIVEIYERQETRTEIMKHLNELTDIQREIVILRFYQELKLKEIAEVLDLPAGTVKSRLFHALKSLKHRLGAEESEGKTDERQHQRS
ncbi:MAG TPA: RNA polymerase sigma factor [Bacillales bacterium]